MAVLVWWGCVYDCVGMVGCVYDCWYGGPGICVYDCWYGGPGICVYDCWYGGGVYMTVGMVGVCI